MTEAPFIATSEALRERRRRLLAAGGLDALRAGCERRTVRRRTYAGGESLHRPEPLHAERDGATPGRWLDPDVEPPADAICCGFDAHDRIVLARSVNPGADSIEHLLTPRLDEDELVIVGHDDAGGTIVEVLHIQRDPSGRVRTVHDQDGTIESYVYDDGGRLRALRVTFEDEPDQSLETTFSYGGEGSLRRVIRTAGKKTWDVWVAEQDAVEDTLPPLRELADDLAPELARATAAAIRAAAEHVDEPRFVLMCARAERFPWRGVLVGRAFLATASKVLRGEELLDAALAASSNRGRALRKLDLLAVAEPALQQRTRRVRQRLARARELDRTTRRAERDEWQTLYAETCLQTLELLNGSEGLANLPVVLWAPRGGTERWEPTIRTAGRVTAEQIEAQLHSDQSTSPIVAPSTRDELRDTARAIGLVRVADQIAHDARKAVALVPTTAGTASRIGGIPCLPYDTAWPEADGRPLTLLASIDCAAIPADVDDRDVLPADGQLLLFAQLAAPSSDAACVLHVPPGTPTSSTKTGAGEQLQALYVHPTSRLTLRERQAACERFDLDAGEETVYSRLLEITSSSPEEVPAQLLGHPQPFQDDPREDDEELLFELHSDADATYLLASTEDLTARRWDAVRAARAWG